MTNNQQLAAHCRDVIANPQDHQDWVVDMARLALASLEAKPIAWFTDDAENDRSATTYDPKMADRWRNKPWFVGELYAAPPVPVMQPVRLPKPCAFHLCNLLDEQEVIKAIRAAGYEVK
jgi:hypothetical protein